MKQMLFIVGVLGFTSAYCGQGTTTATNTTTNTTTATLTTATQAFIYQQLIGNGIGHQEAMTQSQQWHPPMVIPFTNPTNGQEDGQDEGADNE